MKKTIFSFIVIFSLLMSVFIVPAFSADDILVRAEDIRLVYENGATFDTIKGFHLYIRKKSNIESILLTETTKDPEGKNDNYAYRALEYNAINGDEIRVLNGQVLNSKYSQYSLLDSTPEPDKEFGEAFHIYIPNEMAYGYPWTRNGTIKIQRGTYINIRSFEKKYADYDGNFADNPFMFDLGIPDPPPPEPTVVPILTDNYNPKAVESFKEISSQNKGKAVVSKGPQSLPTDVMNSLNEINPKDIVDVVFAIDATGSMKDDMEELRTNWIPKLRAALSKFGSIRLGLLLYRDYGDNFKFQKLPVKKFDFTESIDEFEENLNSFTIKGNEGGDIPEAVYEALYGSMDFFKWRKNAEKKIILIGDAEPHHTPRGLGKYTKELVAKTAASKKITIDTIIVPDNKKDRGR